MAQVFYPLFKPVSQTQFNLQFIDGTVIPFDNSKYQSDFVIYQSEFDDEAEYIIVSREFKPFYMTYELDDLNEFTDEELAEYILFWCIMLSNKMIFRGIYERVFVRNDFNNFNNAIYNTYIYPLYSELRSINIEILLSNEDFTELFKIFIDNDYSFQSLSEPYENTICKYGNVEVLKYYKNKYPTYALDSNAGNIACINNHLECVKFCCENGYSVEPVTLHVIASYGYIDVLKYLYETEKCTKKDLIGLAISAGNNGKVNILEYLNSIDPELLIKEKLCRATVTWERNIDALKFAVQQGCVKTFETLKYCIEKNYVEQVKFCIDNAFPTNETLLEIAVSRTDVELVKYLHQKGLPYDKQTLLAKYPLFSIKEYIESNM